MAIIKSGATSDQLTIDPTSKAARITPYDNSGNYHGIKATYRAATTGAGVVAAAGTGVFFTITGSGTKTIIVKQVRVSGMTLTTLAVNSMLLNRYSTAPTGGTPVALAQVQMDTSDAAATATLVQVYTAAPTAGTLVGAIGHNRHIYKSATVVDGTSFADIVWDFGKNMESKGAYLRGSAQGLGLVFGAAPATAVTLAVEVEWTEET